MTPVDRMPGTDKVDPAVEAELDRLPATPIVELRKRYRELFRAEPPKAFGPDLLRRSIAYRIQERAYGGLSREHQRLLDQLVKAAPQQAVPLFGSYWGEPDDELGMEVSVNVKTA